MPIYYDTEVKSRLMLGTAQYPSPKILAQAFNGEISAFYTHLTEAVLARTHIIVATTPGQIPDVDKNAVEARLAEAARSWSDQLQEALIEERGEEPEQAESQKGSRSGRHRRAS